MAKAREITGIDCGESGLEGAAKVLRARFAEVLEFREAALEAKGIKGVHDMRVAIRRLRSALRDFASALKRKPLKKISKEIKRFADALGAARDEDVAIIALQKLRKKSRDKSVKKEIVRLIEERRARRERAHLDLIEKLALSDMENLQDGFEQTIDEATRHEAETVISFGEAGREIIAKCLREFCDLSVGIYEPFAGERLHELRIAAKRLRYALELFSICWGEAIEPFADGVAQMQDFLGEVHDADVWLESISERLQNADETAANIWLLSEFVEKRTKNYRLALKLWKEWQENNFIGEMRSVVLQNTSQTITHEI